MRIQLKLIHWNHVLNGTINIHFMTRRATRLRDAQYVSVFFNLFLASEPLFLIIWWNQWVHNGTFFWIFEGNLEKHGTTQSLKTPNLNHRKRILLMRHLYCCHGRKRGVGQGFCDVIYGRPLKRILSQVPYNYCRGFQIRFLYSLSFYALKH